MNPTQAELLKTVISSQEALQVEFKRPRRFVIPGSYYEALVVTLAVEDNGKHKWMTSIRLRHKKKHRLKPMATWSVAEHAYALRVLYSEIETVGDPETDQAFKTDFSAHVNRDMTGKEYNLVLRPHLLGAETSKVPTRITNQTAASRLLDKLERELEEK